MSVLRLACVAAYLIGHGMPAAIAQSPGAQPGRPVQAPAPTGRPAAVEPSPERTTASYGDWVMRCERTGDGAAARKICELVQSVQVQGQQAPVAQIAIGRVQKADPLKLTLVLPNNVTLTATPKFSTEDKGGQLVDASWQRCLPMGCLADAVLRDDVLRAMRTRDEQGRIEFKDGAGRDIRLPLSFRGVAQALDALARE